MGMLAHDLVKIAALAAPVSTVSTPGEAGREPAVSISTQRARVVPPNGLRGAGPRPV